MPPMVRVIGRIDRADQVCDVLRRAGLDAHVSTGGPVSVYTGTPPAEGVDVAWATSMYDPPLWSWAKRKHPLRPMVAVAEPRHERVLRGAVSRRHGPDAYLTWPATAAELSAAVERAVASAGRRRTWSRIDVAEILVWGGLVTLYGGRLAELAAGEAAGIAVRALGALAAGVGLLLRVRFAWSPRLAAFGGVLFTAAGGTGLVVLVSLLG